MKVYLVVTVARQVEGEIISVRLEKAYKTSEQANEYAKTLNKVFTETVPSPQGLIQFLCERGVHEIDLED